MIATALGASGFSGFEAAQAAAAEAGTDPAILSVIKTFRQMPGCAQAGIALGLNVDGRETIYTSGSVSYADGRTEPVSADTAFQIGSITKTYTATLYAQLVQEGKLKPDQLVRDLLPPGTQVPVFKDPASGETVEITLDQLAHHTSGLPRQQAIATSPFTDDLMLSSLDRVTLKTRPGAKYMDSLLGIALLAKAIERATGKPFGELIAERITRPLHLDHTRLNSDSDTKLPLGYDRANQPVDRMNIGWPAYEGSGALVSTLSDMMTFLGANMGLGAANGPITRVLPALHAWQTVPCAIPQEGGPGCATIDTGLGWTNLTSKVRGLSTIWKNGVTRGYSAWIGFVAPEANEPSKAGVIALANQSSCPIGQMASCALASVAGRPLAAQCFPAKQGQIQ
jgi:D-alanyl-D-alanine-carboxypeptidase/D-alanyl-D-alanine-endopeptidase